MLEVGPNKSEFAVFLNDLPIFSRMEQRRYPEADELLEICSNVGEQSFYAVDC